MASVGIVVQDEVTLDGHSIRIPASALTLDGFRRWAKSNDFPTKGRISFIGGVVYLDMSPEELETHNQVKTEISTVIYRLVQRSKRGRFYGDRTLVTNRPAGVSNEPDATFVSWESLESGRVHLVSEAGEEGRYMELEGSPDWVLAVVSKTSVRQDTKLMRRRYHRAKVKEYWLVDARGRSINFQLLLYRPKDYVAAPAREGWQRSEVFGCWFRLKRRKVQMSLWEYRLEVKK